MTAKKIIERRRRAKARRKLGYKMPCEQNLAEVCVVVTDPMKYRGGARLAGFLALLKPEKEDPECLSRPSY